MDGYDHPDIVPRSESPNDMELEEEFPFLMYGQEEEVMSSVSTQTENSVVPQSTCYWPPEDSIIDSHTSHDDYLTETKTEAWASSENVYYFIPKTERMSPGDRQGVCLKKDRTPRTAMKMMERHRENERARHHNLNDSLSEICKRVPGSSRDGRETKVVMMQRIISYVAFLENTIVSLCSEMDIAYSNSIAPLTSQLAKDIAARSMYLYPDIDSLEDSEEESPPGKKTKLKLSSPTIDSTSDHMVPEHTVIRDSSQDSTAPTSSFLPFFNDNALSPWLVGADEDKLDGCDYDPFCGSENASTCFSLSPASTSMHSGAAGRHASRMVPDSLGMFSSPGRHSSRVVPDSLGIFSSPSRHSSHVVPDSLGIFSSPEGGEDKENAGGMFMIDRYNRNTVPGQDYSSPFTSSPLINMFPTVQIPSSSSAFISPAMSSLQNKYTTRNKRKQYTPQRSPFCSLSNSSEQSRKVRFEDEIYYGETTEIAEDAENFPLQSLGMTRNQKMELAQLQLISRPFSDSDRDKDIPAKSGKTDLRKTSWMNGFMMFSRLNRRKFINANPGVHTSNISKMMGHTWRGMSTDEQKPYKEKARLCAKEMQKQQELPDHFNTAPLISSTANTCGFFHSDTTNPYLSL